MSKFKSALKKEFFIYLATLLALIVMFVVIFHNDMLSDPLARLNKMAQAGNYAHPFYYSFVVYSVIFILRKSIDFIGSLFKKKTDK